MKAFKSLQQLRQEMKNRLNNWLDNDDTLIKKELTIFDQLMNRREFLQSSAIFVSAMVINQGCSESNDDTLPPSEWADSSYASYQLDDDDKNSVQNVSKIRVDSDIMDSLQSYNPLAAPGSSDALYLKDSAILESFNPHILTVDSADELSESGLNTFNRNYGNPEFVHLEQSSEGSDYELHIFEKVEEGKYGLLDSRVTLSDTSSIPLNRVVSTNGNFHNKIKNGYAYNQKMALVANVDADNATLRLYYQLSNHALLEPGVQLENFTQWKHIDLMEYFETNETHEFTTAKVLDIDTFNDGRNHSFIYGTIQFDTFYNYGFVINSINIDDTIPVITFFAPNFLSIHGDTLDSLQQQYIAVDTAMKNADFTSITLSDWAIFSQQRFIPLTQITNEQDEPSNHIIFIFQTLYTNKTTGTIIDIEGGYANSDVLNPFVTLSSTVTSPFLIGVNTKNGGVLYLRKDYNPSITITAQDNNFAVNLSRTGYYYGSGVDLHYNYSIAAQPQRLNRFDLYKSSFIRSVKTITKSYSSGEKYYTVEIALITPHHVLYDLSVIQNSFSIEYDITDDEVNQMISYNNGIDKKSLDKVTLNDQNYVDLWFDKLKGKDNTTRDLSDAIYDFNQGKFDFFCRQNHQGLLRSYFIVKVNKNISYLITYNEADDGNNSISYSSKTHEDIFAKTIEYNMPLPMTINPIKLYKWNNFIQDNEVLYSAKRGYSVDNDNKLIPNSEKNLLSYRWASSDPLDGTWTTFEQEIQPTADSETLYQTTKHQVNLYVNNIYDIPVEMAQSLYIEVAFSHPVSITEFTDPSAPKYYHVGRFSSLFMKPDSDGRVALEINAGMNEDDMLKGALLMYRLLDTNDFTLQNDEPLAVLSQLNGDTTDFEFFNISFKQLERLATSNAGSIQEGAPDDTATPQQIFEQNAKSGAKDKISEFTDIYSEIYTSAKPKSSSIMQSVAKNRIMGANGIHYKRDVVLHVSRLTHILTYGDPSQRGIFSSISRAVSSATNAISNVVTSAVSELEDIGDDLLDDIKSALNSVVEGIGDVPLVGDALASAIVFVSSKFIMILNKVVSIAKLVWYLLKGIVDMSAAWDIGQELKKLYNDQFSASSTGVSNAYSLLSNLELPQTQDHSISSTSNLFTDESSLESQPSQNTQDNSVKQNYMFDQLERNLPAETASDSSSSETLPASIETMSTMAQSSLNFITKLGSGKISLSTATKELGELFNHIIGNLEDAVPAAIEDAKVLIKELVIDSNPLNSAFSSFSGAEKVLFKTLGLLLFLNPNKFKDFEDVAFFILGFIVNIIGLFFKPILNVDIRSEIRSGRMRSSINGAMSLSPQFRSDDLETTIKVCELLDFINDILIAILENKRFANKKWAKGLLRFCILAPSVYLLPKFYKTLRNDEDKFASSGYYLGIMSNLLNYKRYSTEYIPEKITYLGGYLILNQWYRINIVISNIAYLPDNKFLLPKHSVKAVQGLLKFYREPNKDFDYPTPNADIANGLLIGTSVTLTLIPLLKSEL